MRGCVVARALVFRTRENNCTYNIRSAAQEELEQTWHEQLVRDQMNHYFDIYSRLMRYTVTIVMVLLSPYFTNTCCLKCRCVAVSRCGYWAFAPVGSGWCGWNRRPVEI